MYRKRWIKYKEMIKVQDWNVKIYSISLYDNFRSKEIFTHINQHLRDWLNEMNSFNPSHEFMAFLIVHEASEGVFTLLNTWVGNNMLQTHVFLSEYDHLDTFKKISGDGLFACVWEMEVMNHERKSWMQHILKNAPNPDYNRYLEDSINDYI